MRTDAGREGTAGSLESTHQSTEQQASSSSSRNALGWCMVVLECLHLAHKLHSHLAPINDPAAHPPAALLIAS